MDGEINKVLEEYYLEGGFYSEEEREDINKEDIALKLKRIMNKLQEYYSLNEAQIWMTDAALCIICKREQTTVDFIKVADAYLSGKIDIFAHYGMNRYNQNTIYEKQIDIH